MHALRPAVLFAALMLASLAHAQGTLYQYDLEAKTVRLLLYSPREGYESSSCANWLPDGSAVVFSSHPRFNDAHIFIAPLNDGTFGDVREVGVGNLPSISPDGTELIYAMMPDNPAKKPTGLYRRTLTDDSDEPLNAPLGIAGNFPVWVSENLAVARNVGGVAGLSVIDLKTNEASLLDSHLSGRSVYGEPDASQGRIVALTRPVAEDGSPIENADARRLDLITPTAEGDYDVAPVMPAPDGRTLQWATAGSHFNGDLFFVAQRVDDDRLEIWRVPDGDAEKAEPILRGWRDVKLGSLAPSPDGTKLIFQSNLHEVDGPDGEILSESDLVVASEKD